MAMKPVGAPTQETPMGKISAPKPVDKAKEVANTIARRRMRKQRPGAPVMGIGKGGGINGGSFY